MEKTAIDTVEAQPEMASTLSGAILAMVPALVHQGEMPEMCRITGVQAALTLTDGTITVIAEIEIRAHIRAIRAECPATVSPINPHSLRLTEAMHHNRATVATVRATATAPRAAAQVTGDTLQELRLRQRMRPHLSSRATAAMESAVTRGLRLLPLHQLTVRLMAVIRKVRTASHTMHLRRLLPLPPRTVDTGAMVGTDKPLHHLSRATDRLHSSSTTIGVQ